MKKIFILSSILIITCIAFFDAKDRFKELDEVAANTPSQVEMKQQINKPYEQPENLNPSQNFDNSKGFQKNPQQNGQADKENQLDNFQKRRNSIKNQSD